MIPSANGSDNRHGDAGEYVRLYLAHEPQIRGYILCMVNNWADADDILQETAAILWRKYREQLSESHFLSLALRVAHFEVLGHMRKRKHTIPVFSPDVLEALQEQAAEAIQHEDQRSEALQECIRQLKRRDRELLKCRYELNSTTKQAAAMVGRSMDAAYKALNRIHYQLFICIRQKLAQG